MGQASDGDCPVIRVVEVRPGRWSYMIDGEFPADLYDATWDLTTFPSPYEAQRAAESRESPEFRQ